MSAPQASREEAVAYAAGVIEREMPGVKQDVARMSLVVNALAHGHFRGQEWAFENDARFTSAGPDAVKHAREYVKRIRGAIGRDLLDLHAGFERGFLAGTRHGLAEQPQA